MRGSLSRISSDLDETQNPLSFFHGARKKRSVTYPPIGYAAHRVEKKKEALFNHVTI